MLVFVFVVGVVSGVAAVIEVVDTSGVVVLVVVVVDRSSADEDARSVRSSSEVRCAAPAA